MKEIAELFEKITERIDPEMDMRQLQILRVMTEKLFFRVRSACFEKQQNLVLPNQFLKDVDIRDLSSYGQCGDEMYWKIVNGVLHIGGTGEMWDFDGFYRDMFPAPWASEWFETIVIEDGVTSIGSWAFAEKSLKTIKLPPSVREIRAAAFFNSEIDVLTLPDTLEFIGPDIIAADPCRVSELVLSCDIPYIAPEAFYIRYGHFDKVTLTGNMPENLTALVESHLFRFVPGKVLYPRSWDTSQQSFPDLLCAVIEEEDEILSLCEEDMDALRKVLTPYDT